MNIGMQLQRVVFVISMVAKMSVAYGEDLFSYTSKENMLVEMEKLHHYGGFTFLPFTLGGKDAGLQINQDIQNLRGRLIKGKRNDGLPHAIVSLLSSNQAGYLYSCLAASTSGREIEVIEALTQKGFTTEAPSNAIALYGVYILYNGARDKLVIQKPIRLMTMSFIQAKHPIVQLGKFDNMAETLLTAIRQPIPKSPFEE